jgi:hypothetical protein
MSESDPFIHAMLERTLTEHENFLREQAVSDRRIEQLQAQVREKQHADPERIVHKRFDPSHQRQQAADLSAEAQARWDAWAEQKIRSALAQYRRAETAAIGEAISMLRQEWRREIQRSLENFRLPVLEGHMPGRFYERGSIICAGGSIFQAGRNTTHSPGHADWNPIVSCGEDGQDGRDWNGDRRRVIDLPNPLRVRRTDAA